ncbi:MAG TPA: hypothetical protein VGW10_06505 [Solirubrobacteraceae bacterium]|nr:hypothetical protein [Solirubrobacteraceae bacterium]
MTAARPDGDVEPLWRSRARWRFRGAVLWPAFWVLTVGDALLLGQLPIAGDGGTAFVPALLLSGFFNLVAVAIVAPVAGHALRRRRRDLPRVVAFDHAGTAMLLCVTGALLVGGLIHRDAVRESRHDLLVQRSAAVAYMQREAPPEYRRSLPATSTIKMEDELFRTCTPGSDPDRWFCVYVATDTSPPGVTADDNRESNESLRAAGGFR